MGCIRTGDSGSARGAVYVGEKPEGCKKLGAVEGEGGSYRYAAESARKRATERGATHVLLKEPELDIDERQVTVVRGVIFKCPSP